VAGLKEERHHPQDCGTTLSGAFFLCYPCHFMGIIEALFPYTRPNFLSPWVFFFFVGSDLFQLFRAAVFSGPKFGKKREYISPLIIPLDFDVAMSCCFNFISTSKPVP